MTLEEMEALWRKHDDEFGKFSIIQNKLASRKDLHALIVLDKILPHKEGGDDIISAAEHDQFWLAIDVNELAEVITEEQIIELIRCGVFYDSEVDVLSFFT